MGNNWIMGFKEAAPKEALKSMSGGVEPITEYMPNESLRAPKHPMFKRNDAIGNNYPNRDLFGPGRMAPYDYTPPPETGPLSFPSSEVSGALGDALSELQPNPEQRPTDPPSAQSEKCKACRECCEYVEFPVTMLSLEVVEYFIFRGEQAHIDPKNGVMSIRIFKPCQHLTEQGCGIYDTRPDTCRLYMCDIKDKSIKELKQAMFEEGTRLILHAIQTNREKKK